MVGLAARAAKQLARSSKRWRDGHSWQSCRGDEKHRGLGKTRGRVYPLARGILICTHTDLIFAHMFAPQSTAEVVEENARLHTEISGQQKLNGLQKQELAASNAGSY